MYIRANADTQLRRTKYKGLGCFPCQVRSGLGSSASAAAGLTSGLATAGIGAAVTLAVSGIQMWMNSIQLSHEADTATTQIVNGLEPLLRANVAAFQSGPQTQCNQQISLAAFDQSWQWLTSNAGCGNGAYGSAGNACISDRQRGGKWDWFSYYRDPIATAAVQPNTACPGTTVSGSGTQTDVTNDSINLLPGQGGDEYFALLESSGQGDTGVIPVNSSSPTTSVASALSTPVVGTLTLQELLIPVGLLVAALVLSK
jgi:hypothetical protein